MSATLRIVHLFWLLLLVSACRPASNSAPAAPSPWPADLAAQGEREGRLVWYSALGGGTSPRLAAEIERQYPFLKVELVQLQNSDLLTRATEEQRAGRPAYDLVTASQSTLAALRDLGGLQPYSSAEATAYPAEARAETPDGQLQWVITTESYLGFTYNTRVLSEAEIAHSYQELLKPALKGKMAILGSDAGLRLIGNLARYQGEAFIQRLAGQQLAVQNVSSQALIDLIASGEVPASPSTYRSLVQPVVARGAPIRWVPLEPVTVSALGVAVGRGAPHPAAARLGADVLLGGEARRIMAGLEYGSPAAPLPFQRWDPEQVGTLAEYDALHQRWEALFKSSFGRR